MDKGELQEEEIGKECPQETHVEKTDILIEEGEFQEEETREVIPQGQQDVFMVEDQPKEDKGLQGLVELIFSLEKMGDPTPQMEESMPSTINEGKRKRIS